MIATFALALGTSLPELVVSVKSSLKGKNEMAIGNIIGSNIFNVLLILGVSSLITPLYLTEVLFNFVLPMLIGTTFVFYVVIRDNKISKYEGTFFILLYLVFIIMLFF